MRKRYRILISLAQLMCVLMGAIGVVLGYLLRPFVATFVILGSVIAYFLFLEPLIRINCQYIIKGSGLWSDRIWKEAVRRFKWAYLLFAYLHFIIGVFWNVEVFLSGVACMFAASILIVKMLLDYSKKRRRK